VRPNDESQLIDRAKRHDPEAISELYNRHVDRIFQYVKYRTDDVAVAEDITADVFVRALEALAQYNDYGVPFVAWLYRIAQARVIDHWRRRQRRTTVPLGDAELVEPPADDDSNLDILQQRRLAEAIRLLTEEQQQVITLKFIQGLGNAEIAQVMDKTEGAVKALQRRGLEALARVLKS